VKENDGGIWRNKVERPCAALMDKALGGGTNSETEVKHGETFRVLSGSIPLGRACAGIADCGLRIADSPSDVLQVRVLPVLQP